MRAFVIFGGVVVEGRLLAGHAVSLKMRALFRNRVQWLSAGSVKRNRRVEKESK